ncbi:MAG: acyltransferase [Candidatus Hydrogenedentota bacterium]|nr:MAG: acyltransferase [Candidatus Hydrogenedentota bacterium]
METSYYEEAELHGLGIQRYGRNISISRRAALYAPERITLGDNVRIDDFCILSGNIQIGSYVHIAAYCGLFGQEERISIGDFAGLSSRVLIYTYSDDYVFGVSLTNPTVPDRFRVKFDKGPVIVDKHVIVGAGTVILPNTTIGMGSAVGALSLVRGHVDSWTICRGNPAKPVGKRRSDRILALEKQLLNGS